MAEPSFPAPSQKCGFRDVGAKEFWLGSDLQSDRVMVIDISQPRP